MHCTVHLGPRSYPVILGRNCASALPAKLRAMFPRSRFGLVTNTTLAGIYKKQIAQWKKKLDLTVHVIPDGERYKTIETWSRILDTFLAAEFERSSVLIAFGGGVVGDVAGFAASTMLRGITCVQVPTTLLAMVDSSVGGKTGVNWPLGGKNLVGAFHQPGLVWIDTAFLNTLSKREYIGGLAELFKYAFIGGRGMFDFVSKNRRKLLDRNGRVLLEGIQRSIRIKAHIVEQDERENSGKRMLLNFGHTFAHALEKYFGFEKLHHGEAVWYGMACACELGKILKTIPQSDMPAYEALLAAMPRPKLPLGLMGLPVAGTERQSHLSADACYRAMQFDKKVSGGKIRFVVPAKAGKAEIKSGVSKDAVMRAMIKFIKK